MRRKEHDELISQNADLKNEVARLNSLVGPLNVEATKRREVQLIEEIRAFLIGLHLFLVARGSPKIIRGLFPEDRDALAQYEAKSIPLKSGESRFILSPGVTVLNLCWELGIKLESRPDKALTDLSKRWWENPSEPTYDAFTVVYDAVKSALPLYRQPILKLGLDVGQLAKTVIDPDEHDDFMITVLRDQFHFAETASMPDSIVIPWVVERVTPLVDRIEQTRSHRGESMEKLASELSNMIAQLQNGTALLSS